MRTYTERISPWESNPAVFNDAALSLGLSPRFEFRDIFLDSIPDKTFAIIVAYTTRKEYEEEKEREARELPQQVDLLNYDDVFWFRQTIDNYCGPLALIHATLNGLPSELSKYKSGPVMRNLAKRGVGSDSVLQKVRNEYLCAAPSCRHSILDNEKELFRICGEIGQMGETQVLDSQEEAPAHFVSFVVVKGTLFLLDGDRLNGPVVIRSELPPEWRPADMSTIVRDFLTKEALNPDLAALLALVYK